MADFRKKKSGKTEITESGKQDAPKQPVFQNISREEVVIRRMFDDPVIQNKLVKHLSSDLFDDPIHQNLCTGILKGFKKYGRFPQPEELSLALPDNSAEKIRLSKIMNLRIKKIDRDIIIDVIENYFREKKTENILSEAAEAIHEKNFEDIGSLINELQESVNFSLYMDIGLNLTEDVDEALRRLNETHKPIPSALSDIRAWTMQGKGTGGWYRGLSIFMGMPNVGKTILLCNEAAYSFQNGYNVLYVTLEMEEALIWERIAVNVTDIPLNKIRSESGGDVKKLLKERKIGIADKCGELYVREMSSATTPMDIENLINEIKLSEGIDIDICFIDYIQIMKPVARAGAINRNASLYSQGKEVAEQLRDLSRKHKMPVVTPSQLNRDGYSNTSADMRNTAGSAGLNDTADFIITIMSDPYLEKCNMFLHTIVKNRFGSKMVTFLSECDILHMRVRSASNEKRKKYSESQVNQTIEIANFNTDGKSGDGTPTEKNAATVDKEKEDNESERFNKIQRDIIRKEREKGKKDESVINEEKNIILDKGEDISKNRDFKEMARLRREKESNNGI